MLFIASTLLGYVSYKQLPVELLPNAELPMLYVSVSSPQDMDPGYVESEVIIPLEGAISSVGGVEQIVSEVSSRQSSIRVDFKSTVNFKTTSLRLEEDERGVGLSSGYFNVSVQKMDVSMMSNAFMTLQVRAREGRPGAEYRGRGGGGGAGEYRWCAGVQVFGGRERAIEVQLDREARPSVEYHAVANQQPA